MPIVNIQGVGQVNFPDTMSNEQIQSAIEKEILPKFPEVQAQVPRGIIGGAKDLGASFVAGLGNTLQVPGQLGELIGFQRTGDLPDREKTGLQSIGQQLQTFGQEAKSPTLVAKEQLRAREMEKTEGFFDEAGTMLRTTATDPALLSSFFVEQLPNFIASYGVGALGKGGAKLLMKEATEASLAKVGVSTAIGGNAVMQGTDIGYDTYQSVYKELRKQGVPEEEAQGIALSKGRIAALEAAGISLAATKLPGGASIERAMLGKGLPGTTGFLKSTLGETFSEALEEGGGAFAKQIALNEVNPEIGLLKGVGAATALGGLGGALMGAPAGVVNAMRARAEAQQPAIEPPPPEMTGEIPVEPPVEIPVQPPVQVSEPLPSGVPEAPVEAPPVIQPPVEAPVSAAPPVTTPPTFAEEDPFANYFTGMPEGSEIIFQNRDRSTLASIEQMQDISSKLDYSRVSQSRDFGNGAPVVISDIDLEGSLARNPDQPLAVTGMKDFAVLPDGSRVPTMYAVVENGVLLSSNNADGSKRSTYEDISKPGLRAIAGNGRIAGITNAYTNLSNNEVAQKYKQDLIADANNLGINPAIVERMTAPVLVRVMPKSFLTPNIADLSNRPTVARLSPVETAKNDIRRFDLGGLEFNEDGTPSGKTLMQFINAMPVEERTELTDKKGQPTTQAMDRLANAIFQKAYGSDALIDLYAQAADPEAKTILNALARVAPKMAQLEGAGEYDVRSALIQAAEMAVNARRSGMKLADAARQVSIDADPNAGLILDMFAKNSRSGKRIGERLNALADEALAQVQAGGTDMFGAVPKKPIAEIYKALQTPAGEPGLFDEPAPVEAPKTKPAWEPIDFDIDKPKEKIAKEIDGITIPELAQWTIDNAPNSAAKAVATRVKKVIDSLNAKRMVPKRVGVRNGKSRWTSGRRGVTSTLSGPSGTTFQLEFNGVDANGDADTSTGTSYVTILHELLHVATNGELRLLKDTSPIYKDLNKVLAKVRKQVRLDVAAGKKSPILSRIGRGANTIKNPRELVAWGLTDTDFQLYLKNIKVGKKNNLFNELVDVFRRLLGINEEYETALEAVIRSTDEILGKPIADIAAETSKIGVRFDNEKMEIDEEGVGKEEATFLYQDNPGGSWLQDQIERNKESGIKASGAYRRFGSATGRFTSREGVANTSRAVLLPVSILKNIRGINDEQNNVRQKDLDSIVGYMSEKNKLPPSKGDKDTEHYYPFINVDFRGIPFVNEGNHRIMAAEKLGYKYLPVQFSYFSGGEDVDSILSPDRVMRYNKQAYDEGYSLKNYSPEKVETDEETVGEKVAAKTKQVLQKRKMPEGVFSDVDPGLMDIAKPLFYPEQKTIVDKVAGMKDDFFKKLAQGVADQYRSIKDYSEVGYMQARMSKTVDGALEGLTFFGHVFNNGGALDIKKNTKGLMEILKPVGKEVDRYQMWVALNREAQLPMEKRTKMAGIGELIKRRNEFAAGTIDGKNRVDVYEKVRSDMNGLNKSVLKVALDAGLIDSSRQKIEDIKSRDYLTGADREILTRQFRDEIERIEAKKAMNVTEDDKQTLKDYRAIIRDINGMEKMTPDIQNELIQYYTDNPGAFERFSADINYIPFYRAMEDGDLQGASTASGLTNQQFSRELKGGERAYGDLMENTMRNWSHILSAAMKNQASNTILNDATEMGAATPNLKVQYTLDDDGKVVSRSSGEVIGDGSVKPYMTTADKGAIKVMRDGQPIYYRVLDPMLLDSISSIGYMGPKSKFLDVARDFKNMLQFGVTVSPAFKVRNLFRDSVSALAVTDLKKNPFANVIDGWISSDRNNPAHISALAGGAIFNFGTAYEGDQSKLIKRLLDKGVDANTILDSPEKVKQGLTVLWEKYKDWGNKSESANRMALYNQLKAKGYDHLQASFYARDLLDFSMQGAWPAFRLAAQTIPFLNARVQGLYKLGRDGVVPTSRVLYNTLTGKEIDANDAQKARSFSYTTGAVALASMLLYLAFKDDEEYQKREQWDRDNFWWIRLPGMDFAFRIPKPFEIGAFGTMAERVLEQIVDKDAEGKAFGDSVFRMLTDTFAINPIPQVVRPLMDIYANKDSFTGAPIESAGMERLSKQERVTDNTSPIAQALGGISSLLGDKASLSPVQVDYAIKAYFGWLGGTATQMSVYAVQPFKDGEYPDLRLMDKVSQGFLKSLPSDQSRYVTAFYENNKQISQAYADMRHYAELGDSAKVQKILEEQGDKIALSKMYDKNAKEMAKVRAHIRTISNDPNMDGTTKREMLDRMRLIISDLAEQSESARKFLKQ
jgi:hypothetical protein